MRISIYSSQVSDIQRQKSLVELLTLLPTAMHGRAKRYKAKDAAYNYVIGRLLLKKGLQDFGMARQFENIRYQNNDKPILDGIYFNISHTDDLVVCAMSKDGDLGVDIEKVKPIELDHFESWFTKREWNDIMGVEQPERRFYWYWTRKESIIKAMGVNLDYLNRVEVQPETGWFELVGKKWYLQDLDFGEEYYGVVCGEGEMEVAFRKTETLY